jgi:hypothetical protein
VVDVAEIAQRLDALEHERDEYKVRRGPEAPEQPH